MNNKLNDLARSSEDASCSPETTASTRPSAPGTWPSNSRFPPWGGGRRHRRRGRGPLCPHLRSGRCDPAQRPRRHPGPRWRHPAAYPASEHPGDRHRRPACPCRRGRVLGQPPSRRRAAWPDRPERQLPGRSASPASPSAADSSWFGRKHGWVADHVTAFDIVDAEGRQPTAHRRHRHRPVLGPARWRRLLRHRHRPRTRPATPLRTCTEGACCGPSSTPRR